MRNARLLITVEASAVLLFLLHSVRVLFSVLFGIIYDTVFGGTTAFTETGAILTVVVAAFLAPVAVPRRAGDRWLAATALATAVARVPVTLNLPSVRLWGSVAAIAAGSLYAATLVRQHPRHLPPGLLIALTADQMLRAAGNTFDLTLRPWWWPVQLALVAGVGWLGWLARRSVPVAQEPEEGGLTLCGGLALGALLFLETSLLGFPNALARWSRTPYEVASPLLMAATVLPLMPGVRKAVAPFLQGALGGLMALFLILAGLAAGRTVGGMAGLVGMLVVQCLLLITCLSLVGGPGERKGWRRLALGWMLLLVMNFAFAFTFTYPYTVPAFRGMGPAVVLVAGGVAALPALRWQVAPATGAEHRPRWHLLVGAAPVALAVAFAWPRPLVWRDSGPIRVGTYNIHYGYNTTWQLSLEDQARTIEESGAEVVMLQEVDTCRITSYGVDHALWLARRLGMQAVYQPTLEGLSGIAILTRFPVEVAEGALLRSQLEQTGIVHVRLRVGEQSVDTFGLWLGLEPQERAGQLADALAFIGDASPALLGGDFNATPDSPVYARLVASGFTDPFMALGLGNVPTDPAVQPRSRIDFVWGRGLNPTAAVVLPSLASDHRMVVTQWSLP